MVEPVVLCALCGSECGRVVTATINGQEINFCCKGCVEVYWTLHESDDPTEGPTRRETDSAGGA